MKRSPFWQELTDAPVGAGPNQFTRNRSHLVYAWRCHSIIFVYCTGMREFVLNAAASGFNFRKSAWQGQQDSNPRPSVLETDALPTELYPFRRGEGLPQTPCHGKPEASAKSQFWQLPLPKKKGRPDWAAFSIQ
jgi:hypothetical protein